MCWLLGLAGTGEDGNSDFEFSQAAEKIKVSENTRVRIYDKTGDSLLDRHKVCACMVTAIIKVWLLSCNMTTDDRYAPSNASRINEQLAFMCGWELFKGFIISHVESNKKKYK